MKKALSLIMATAIFTVSTFGMLASANPKFVASKQVVEVHEEVVKPPKMNDIFKPVPKEMILLSATNDISEVIEIETEPETVEVIEEVETQAEPELSITQEEIELIALVTMAEAEGECEEGKRLVIDTILNRLDSGYYADTISGVIYQPHQFSSMWNGRVDRCYVREDICQLVKEELQNRYNSEVIYFRTGRYSDYGVPVFKVGNHYFSKRQ